MVDFFCGKYYNELGKNINSKRGIYMIKMPFKKAICATLAICAVLALSSCGEKSGGTSSATQADTTEATTIEQTTAAEEMKKETDLTALHAVKKDGDAFAGMWQITDGTGSQLESFVYEFDGDGNAYMMIGTMGYTGTYGLKTTDGKETFTTQLMFGLNGTYTYKFSDDKNSVVLTNTEDKTTSTLERVNDFSPVPEPVEDPQIDEALLGAWSDDTGAYLYFGKDGLMYFSQADISFSFYTYSAGDGKITQTYSMKEETEETATYSVSGDTLTYNKYEYQRISADKLV